MMRVLSLLVLFFAALFQTATAQQTPVYSNYFVNPVLMNPAYTGTSGFTELSLNYRNQWTGIEGAPTGMNAILQVPVNTKLSFGLNVLGDSRGALSTYESSLMTSYHLPISKNAVIDFGLQLGVGRNNIDFTGSDPAIDRALENSWYATGAFGMHLGLGNLNVSFALPELFENDILNESNFEELGLDVTEQTLTSVSYKFALSPQWTAEPFALYRTDKEGRSQWEAAGLVTFRDIAWIGASYRQESGIGGLVGFAISDWLRLNYAYDAGNETIGGFSNGSHEIQLNLRLGKRNKRAPKQVLITENTTQDTVESLPKDEITEEATVAATTKETAGANPASSKSEEAVQPDVKEVQEVHEAIQESAANEIAAVNVDYSREKELRDKDDNELNPGFYVVVGAFKVPENADRYSQAVEKKGYTSRKGFSPVTGFTYVYIMFTDSENQAKQATRSIKQIKTLYFPEAWVLHIGGQN